jgi:hypothetical protein
MQGNTYKGLFNATSAELLDNLHKAIRTMAVKRKESIYDAPPT